MRSNLSETRVSPAGCSALGDVNDRKLLSQFITSSHTVRIRLNVTADGITCLATVYLQLGTRHPDFEAIESKLGILSVDGHSTCTHHALNLTQMEIRFGLGKPESILR